MRRDEPGEQVCARFWTQLFSLFPLRSAGRQEDNAPADQIPDYLHSDFGYHFGMKQPFFTSDTLKAVSV